MGSMLLVIVSGMGIEISAGVADVATLFPLAGKPGNPHDFITLCNHELKRRPRNWMQSGGLHGRQINKMSVSVSGWFSQFFSVFFYRFFCSVSVSAAVAANGFFVVR